MGEQFKLDSNGTCNACKEVSVAEENLECFMCKCVFHGNCAKMSNEERVGTKSLINHINRPSTQKNFKFFCNSCLTKFEVDLANVEAKRLTTVEENITTIKSELEDIKKLLKESSQTKVSTKGDSVGVPRAGIIWFDKARLESTKVAPAKPILVVNNAEEINDSIEKAIVDNSIPVTKSYKNNAGELVVECESLDSRDQLQRLIATTNDNVEMRSFTKKKPSVNIVGMSRQYSKEEIISQLVSNNQHIKQFATVNNINEHIEIHDVKSTRAKPSVFQAFASVSDTLRKGLRNYKDKVTIGLLSCKVYDRFHVKRCNNCQGIGHYYKDCQNEPRCAKCSLDHATSSCQNSEIKCVNCEKAGNDANHTAYDPKCPVLMSEVEKKKNLNLQRMTTDNR